MATFEQYWEIVDEVTITSEEQEIYDSIDARVVLKHAAQYTDVGAVAFNKHWSDASDFLDTVKNIDVAVRQVVDNYYFITCILKFDCGMRSYKSHSTSY